MPEMTLTQAIEAVDKAIREGNLGQAENVCRQILQAQPNSVEALQLMGMICSQKGDANQAAEYFKQALAKGSPPSNAPGETDQAIRELTAEVKSLNANLLKTKQLFTELFSVFHYDYVADHNPRFKSEKRLLAAGCKVYSQSEEDGMIEEIFNRIGEGARTFVEFGVGNGNENNSLYLLQKGWSGVWIEGSARESQELAGRFGEFVDKGKLKVRKAFITAENIDSLFQEAGVPSEFDMLSIDIDGNDYWVWKALEKFSPRMVVIEYNSTLGPHVSWTIPYNPDHHWDGTNYSGASLKALEHLGNKKGYKLVGCNLSGVNAFFVRDDLVGDKFEEPFTAANHYEPPRLHFSFLQRGFPRVFSRQFADVSGD